MTQSGGEVVVVEIWSNPVLFRERIIIVKVWHISKCSTSATLQSCKVTQAIWIVHDQPESLCRRPYVVNLMCAVKDRSATSNSWCPAPVMQHCVSRSQSPEMFWSFSAVRLTVFLFEFWPHSSTIKLYEKKKSLQDQRLWFWSNVSEFGAEIDSHKRPWRILPMQYKDPVQNLLTGIHTTHWEYCFIFFKSSFKSKLPCSVPELNHITDLYCDWPN